LRRRLYTFHAGRDYTSDEMESAYLRRTFIRFDVFKNPTFP